MSHFAKLKIVAQQQKRLQSKSGHPRSKLLEKRDDQLAVDQALISGEVFSRNRRIWQTNEEGQWVLVDRPERMHPLALDGHSTTRSIIRR